MPEDLKVDCFECSDLEFARNLARQMKEGYGRHNSNRTFRDNPRRGRIISASGEPIDPNALFESWRNLRETQQARIIGRCGDTPIRENWKDCAVGEFTRVLPYAPDAPIHVLRQPVRGWRTPSWDLLAEIPIEAGSFADFTFERVRWRMTPDGGRTWQEETFWKRIE